MSFTPTIITTSNVKETLIETAQDNKLLFEQLSFDLLGVASYYKQASSKSWIQLDEKLKTTLLQKKYLAHKRIAFQEHYKIKIFKKPLASKDFMLNLSLRSNPSQTKVILVIQKSTKLALTKTCAQEFINEIRRKLLLSGFMLGIFTVNLQNLLQSIVEIYKKKNAFVEDIKIVISQALEPKTNYEQYRIFHYLQKEEDQRTAYEKGVDEDELILEVIFPIISQGGRNCKGDYLPPYGPSISSNEVYYHDDSIKMIPGEKGLKFYALKAGYVDLEDNKIAISNTLNLKEAAFKTTGSITVGGHRDVDLKITSNDPYEDAINKGVDIDVSSIDVRGSIAGNTSLKAESINIGAQTHKTTHIIAEEDACVYLHRGNLTAKNAIITKLEQGLVKAQTVQVEEILGGEIRAKQVKANIIHSNAKIYASESIEITQIKGKHNKFIIAPDKVEDQEAIINKIEAHLLRNRKQLDEMEKIYKKHLRQYNIDYEQIDEFKKQVSLAIKKGVTPPKIIAIRVKQYGIDTKRLETLTSTLEALKVTVNEIITTLNKYQNIMYHATISFEGSWDGTQEIFYEHPNSNIIEKYIPHGFIKKIIYTEIASDQLISVVSA